LNEFTYHSKNLAVEYVDPDREPSRAKAAGIQSYGTIVVEYGGRTERVTSTNEADLTNALIKAVTGAARKVYFTQGHGEKDTAGTDRVGYSAVSQGLTGDNYGVEHIVLVQQKSVPADATVVIIAGPKTDFLQPEIDALKEYLARGGKVLAMLDPPEKGQAEQPLLKGLLHDWGIDAGTNIVVDASGIGQLIGADASVPVVAQYPNHQITESLRGVMTAYPLARSMSPVDGGVNGHTAQAVLQTGGQSWAETDLASLATGRVEMDPTKDLKGPVTLGAAVSAPATAAPAPAPASTDKPDAAKPEESPNKPESRLVALGDSDFAANAFLGVQGNKDLFMNTVNWLAQQENMIAIRPREPEDRRLTLTADQQQRIMLLSIFIIPGLVFASGVYTWWKRR
jgi:ABC-type uncharacterized transport system involved in gliding motility auxiliary subunit